MANDLVSNERTVSEQMIFRCKELGQLIEGAVKSHNYQGAYRFQVEHHTLTEWIAKVKAIEQSKEEK